MIPQLLHSFGLILDFIERSVADLSEAQMVRQPGGVSNHAAWTLGHLIYSFHEIGVELGAEPWLPADWAARFATGSTPTPDPALYPSRSELLALFAEAYRRSRQSPFSGNFFHLTLSLVAGSIRARAS